MKAVYFFLFPDNLSFGNNGFDVIVIQFNTNHNFPYGGLERKYSRRINFPDQ